jgi:hypothetical protein
LREGEPPDFSENFANKLVAKFSTGTISSLAGSPVLLLASLALLFLGVSFVVESSERFRFLFLSSSTATFLTSMATVPDVFFF